MFGLKTFVWVHYYIYMLYLYDMLNVFYIVKLLFCITYQGKNRVLFHDSIEFVSNFISLTNNIIRLKFILLLVYY